MNKAKRPDLDFMAMPIPTESDWGDYHSAMDAEYAHEKFAGKTFEQMVAYVETCPLSASECLSYMPAVPFQYYIRAFKIYLLSDSAFSEEEIDASDAASTFLLLVRETLKYRPEIILPIMDELDPLIEFIADNQEKYHAAEEIYGSFEAVQSEIQYLVQLAKKSDSE